MSLTMSLEGYSEDETLSLLIPSEEFTSTSTVQSAPGLTTNESKWIPILMGQVASVLICLSGVTSILLTQYGFASPCLQNCVSYMFISVVFTTFLAANPGVSDDSFESICKNRGWKYFLISMSDVAGNYLVVLAYQYTSLTSVQLLDCFSIPTVLVLSYVFLKSRYGYFHYLGIFLCLLGVAFLIWADVQSGRTSDGPNPVVGDFMCLSGAFLYGLSNVCQEFFVKSFNPYEFLGFIGFFGSLISAVQTILFEDFSELTWTWQSVVLLIAFALVQFGFYTIVAHLLTKSNAVAINLSILSADFYSIVVGLFIFEYSFSVLYFMSFMLVVGGVGVFTLRPIISAVAHHSVSHATQTADVGTSVN